MSLYDGLRGQDDKGTDVAKVPIWPVMITLWQVSQGDLTVQQAAARYPEFNIDSRRQFQSVLTWAVRERSSGKTDLEIFHELWHTFCAVEFQYMTKAAFNTKFRIG
jgi:hypothetical protein